MEMEQIIWFIPTFIHIFMASVKRDILRICTTARTISSIRERVAEKTEKKEEEKKQQQKKVNQNHQDLMYFPR